MAKLSAIDGRWTPCCSFMCLPIEEEFFLGELTEVSAPQRSTEDSWKAKVSLNGLLAEFKLDTAADVTVIPPSMYHSLHQAPLLSRTTRLASHGFV